MLESGGPAARRGAPFHREGGRMERDRMRRETLDDDTLFYFASRGMDEKTAERVLTRAKLERICRRIPDAQSREETENLLKTVMNDGQDD